MRRDLILCIAAFIVTKRTDTHNVTTGNVVCSRLPDELLTEILGPAFNSRYMSIDVPVDDHDMSLQGGYKRTSGGTPSFFVDDEYASALTEDDDEEPAWTVNHVKMKKKVIDGEMSAEGTAEKVKRAEHTEKRAAASVQRQWECESKIHWMDLGVGYFPRYLRSVECIAKTCWYGHYKCKPRSFTVKILRRKRDRCVVASPGNKVGLLGLPSDLRELWVWEERAVNFCCDCAL